MARFQGIRKGGTNRVRSLDVVNEISLGLYKIASWAVRRKNWPARRKKEELQIKENWAGTLLAASVAHSEWDS